jgi:hypothetical protein
MLRRGSLVVLVMLSTGCGSNKNNPFQGAQTSPPSADAVVVFVSAAWSADVGRPRELFAVNADGTKVERLTHCAEAEQPCDMISVALSPDKNRLVAIRTVPNASPGATGLYFMDLSRGVEKMLFQRRRISAADWSLDGSFLIYSALTEGLASDDDLYYCLPDGTSDSNLTSTSDVRERSPRIDPFGRTAVFEQLDATGVGRIALYASSGGVPISSGTSSGETLPNTSYVVGGDADPAFAPDATRVVFRRLTGAGNGGLGTWDLMSVGSDGKDARTIVTGTAAIGAPDWGRTGIAYVETDAAAGRARLVVVQPDGSGRRVLREESAAFQMGAARWIPGN